MICHAGDDLVKHHIDACHILTVKCAEIVASASHVAVPVVVLNDVTHIHYSVFTAPFAHPVAEGFFVKTGYGVHVRHSVGRGHSVHAEPKCGQMRLPVFSVILFKLGANEAVPRVLSLGV